MAAIVTHQPKPTTITIQPINTFSPALASRAWHTQQHPTLPHLFASAWERGVALYSTRTWSRISSVSGGHQRSVRACAWQPGCGAPGGESVLVTASFDRTIGIWRRQEEEGEEEEEEEDDGGWHFAAVLEGHDSEVKHAAFNASGNLLATCGRDKSVWIWEELGGGSGSGSDDWETVAVLQEHEADVKCVAWHPELNVLASASYDDSLRLWCEDADDWVCCARLDGHASTVWCVCWEKQDVGRRSRRLASCAADAGIRIWRRVSTNDEEEDDAAAATSNGTNFPSILRTHSVEEDWECLATLPKMHDADVYAIDWSAASGRLASIGSDSRLVVYEERLSDQGVAEWIVLAFLDNAHGVYEINHVCWAKKSKDSTDEMLITTGDDGEIKAWQLSIS